MALFQDAHGFLRKTSRNGFTLIELILVVAILSVLMISLVMTFNPLTQFNKAGDGQREHDFEQIQRALDSYFNDTHCYPTTLLFGTSWVVNGQVYMEKIPQDPTCKTDPNHCYVYEAGPTACPQWNVLYAALKAPVAPANACPLVTLNANTPCLPKGFTANQYNYCALSGSVDCSVVSTFTIGSGSQSGGGQITVTPTPGLPQSCPGNTYYGCTGDNRCNSIAPSSQCVQFGGTVSCVCDSHCNQMCLFN